MLGRGSATQMKRRLVAVKVPTAADQRLVVSMRTVWRYSPCTQLFPFVSSTCFRRSITTSPGRGWSDLYRSCVERRHHAKLCYLPTDSLLLLEVKLDLFHVPVWVLLLEINHLFFSLFASFGAHFCLPRSATLGNAQTSQVKGGRRVWLWAVAYLKFCLRYNYV